MCIHTRTCTSTCIVHWVRGLRVRPFSITPPFWQPHSVFGGFYLPFWRMTEVCYVRSLLIMGEDTPPFWQPYSVFGGFYLPFWRTTEVCYVRSLLIMGEDTPAILAAVLRLRRIFISLSGESGLVMSGFYLPWVKIIPTQDQNTHHLTAQQKNKTNTQKSHAKESTFRKI